MHETIRSIYDAATGHCSWDKVLDLVADITGAEAANLFIASPRLGLANVLSPRSDPELINGFFNGWHKKDPSYPLTVSAPVGHPITLADSGREEFYSSEFYTEFWRKFGHGGERIRANLIANRDLQVGFGLVASQAKDEISDEMRATYLTLLPHMIRATEIEHSLRRLEMQAALGTAARASHAGIIVVNSAGHVLHCDDRAEAILDKSSALKIVLGTLTATHANDAIRIEQMIRNCVLKEGGKQPRGGSVHRLVGGKGRIDLSVIPMPATPAGFALVPHQDAEPAALLVIEDSTARHREMVRRVSKQFGLTSAEGRVAVECLRGGSRDTIARNLGVKPATIRTHLSNIYAKMSVNRRSDMVRLMFRHGFAD